MKMLVTQIDESYAAPPGTLHLGSNGWVMDRPEKLKIRTNRSLKDFMQLVADQCGGLLGEGELVFAVFDPKGCPCGLTGVMEYEGRILFSGD
jgi:hypothetical protein